MDIFNATEDFYSSHKMGDAQVDEARLEEILGKGHGPGDKSDNEWTGILTVNVGTDDEEMVKVACWDWKGGMRAGCGVSIWANKHEYLQNWKDFLEKNG